MRPDENRSIQTVLNAATARSRREAVAGLSAIAALVVFPVNANAEPTMTETHLQQNKVVVANFIEVVWRQGRLGELGNYWSNNCVNHTDPATANIGLDQLRRYHEGFSQAFAGFTSTTIEIVQQVAEGDPDRPPPKPANCRTLVCR
jgi:hypothetical protein